MNRAVEMCQENTSRQLRRSAFIEVGLKRTSSRSPQLGPRVPANRRVSSWEAVLVSEAICSALVCHVVLHLAFSA